MQLTLNALDHARHYGWAMDAVRTTHCRAYTSCFYGWAMDAAWDRELIHNASDHERHTENLSPNLSTYTAQDANSEAMATSGHVCLASGIGHPAVRVLQPPKLLPADQTCRQGSGVFVPPQRPETNPHSRPFDCCEHLK